MARARSCSIVAGVVSLYIRLSSARTEATVVMTRSFIDGGAAKIVSFRMVVC